MRITYSLFLLLVGCSLEGGPHWAADDRPRYVNICETTSLEGSDDCQGVDKVLTVCAEEISKIPLLPLFPLLVQVDPMYSRITGGTSAGTSNHDELAIIVIDADWVWNATCHEEIHLAERRKNFNHTGWHDKNGPYEAIERVIARMRTWENAGRP